MIEPGKLLYEIIPDGGLVTRYPAHRLQPSQSPDAQNFDPSEGGGCKKRKGFIKFTNPAKSSPTGTYVTGLIAASTASVATYVLATEGTALHNISGGDWTTTISGATLSDAPTSFAMFNNIFLICNQGGGPYKWTGSGAAASLGGSPPANARYVAVHRSRAWLALNTSVLYFSALSNPEDWTTADSAGSITINVGDGMVINGIASGGDFLLVSKIDPHQLKEGKLYVIFGSGPSDFSVRKVADLGAMTKDALVPYDNFVAVAGLRGLYGVQGRRLFKLSDPIQPTWDAIPTKTTMAIGRHLSTLRIAYPASGSVNNRELVLDVERGVWGLNTGKTIRQYTNHPDGRLLAGTSSTSILVWEQESGTNDDGSAINWYWETPDMIFESTNSAERLSSTLIHAKNTGSYSVTLEHYINGTAQSYNKTMNVSTEGPVKRFVHFNKRGQKHRLRLTNNTSGEDITIYDIGVYGQEFQPLAK